MYVKGSITWFIDNNNNNLLIEWLGARATQVTLWGKFVFLSKVPEFLHVLFNLVGKHSPVSFFGWNALVRLCCIHLECFDILSSFFSETKCKTAKNLQGNGLLLNWKAYAKIQAFFKEKQIYSKKSLTCTSLLHQAIQLYLGRSFCITVWGRYLCMTRSSFFCSGL